MKKLNFIVATFSATLFLSACGNANIDAVKKHYADENRTITYSQLLDNRKICEKSSWNTEKDQNNRDIVVYSCHLKGSQDAFAEDRRRYKERLKKRSDDNDESSIEAKATKRYPITTDFIETYKWTVNEDKEPNLTLAQLEVKVKKTENSNEPLTYPLSKNLATAIKKSKAQNAKEYLAEIAIVSSLVDFFVNSLEQQAEELKDKLFGD